MRARLICACAVVLAIVLAGCGDATRSPSESGGPQPSGKPTESQLASASQDPRGDPLRCLQGEGVDARLAGANGIQIGSPPNGAFIRYAANPGEASSQQLRGDAEGAEVIGAAVLFINGTPDSKLEPIEKCLAAQVGY